MTAAKALIAKAQQNARRTTPLPKLAVEMVREICAYNDEQRNNAARVGIEQMCETLSTDFGWKGGRDALNAVCRAQLGRRSYAQAGSK